MDNFKLIKIIAIAAISFVVIMLSYSLFIIIPERYIEGLIIDVAITDKNTVVAFDTGDTIFLDLNEYGHIYKFKWKHIEMKYHEYGNIIDIHLLNEV